MLDESDLLPGEYFAAVPVTVFPFAENPFRCPHNERFCEVERACGDAPDGVAGARWHLTLTNEDFAVCEFHDADWCAIADASVAALDMAGPHATNDDLFTACEKLALPERDALWLCWLFAEPIAWRPGSPCVNNGQHRLCALRAAGAERVAADTLGYPAPKPTHSDPSAAALTIVNAHDAHHLS